MKKLLFLFVMVFAFTMCFSGEVEAQVTSKVGAVLSNSVDSVYHDGRAMVDTLYHDSKAVVGTVYSDMKDGAVGVYPDVKAAIISIGKALGIAAEHVYGVLVKQYFVHGVKQLFMLITGLLMLIIGYIGWKRVTTNNPISYRVIVPSIIMLTGLITMCDVNYDDMFTGLINPEYGAINYILEYTKSLVK
jgi:hypothetical protein